MYPKPVVLFTGTDTDALQEIPICLSNFDLDQKSYPKRIQLESKKTTLWSLL